MPKFDAFPIRTDALRRDLKRHDASGYAASSTRSCKRNT